ncbi:MAG: hypothetical protein E7523_03635 [Ruminococcaceae bacterium]|nr:hypothetical protein [Oscillospiraceae bacterium]
MKYKKMSKTVCVLLCFSLALSFAFSASAAFTTFETQFEHEQINKAWLTDLTVNESLTGISDMVTSVTLVAQPEYPYTETPESFKDDVKDACALYELDEGSARAAYIYLFEVLNNNSSILEDDASDTEIKQYLIDLGIVYPDNTDADTLVMARALYVILKSGSLDLYLQNDKIPTGTALEAAIVSYMSVITGIDMLAIREWTTVSDNLSLDEYILAMSKYSLWSAGYDVTMDMTEEEVYRLIALMTIRKQGITAPDNISFEEIKIRYLAAMLGTRYGVSCNADDLAEAVNQDCVAFYLLQLMGQDAQLSLRMDSIFYEDAFARVAEYTDRFDMEIGEFYADVCNYTATLKYKRSSIWLYPTSYVCNNENNADMITITANGNVIEDGNFNEIKLNPELESQVITIKCVYDYNTEKFTATYNLKVVQGLIYSDSVLVEDPDISDILSGNYELDESLYAPGYIQNDSDLVGSILGSIGLGVGFGDLLDTFTSSSVGNSTVSGSIATIAPPVNTNPTGLTSVLENGFLTILPSAGTFGSSSGGLKDTSITMSVTSMEQFSKINHAEKSNVVLSGIGGLELYSIAESVGSLLLAGGSAAENVASPIVGSVIHDAIFDDGDTVIGASVSNGVSADNTAYVSALSDKAVSVYANGDATVAGNINLDQYLSHQQQANNSAVDTPVSGNAVINVEKQSNSSVVLFIVASLAAVAGVVLIVVSKQRKISYQ